MRKISKRPTKNLILPVLMLTVLLFTGCQKQEDDSINYIYRFDDVELGGEAETLQSFKLAGTKNGILMTGTNYTNGVNTLKVIGLDKSAKIADTYTYGSGSSSVNCYCTDADGEIYVAVWTNERPEGFEDDKLAQTGELIQEEDISVSDSAESNNFETDDEEGSKRLKNAMPENSKEIFENSLKQGMPEKVSGPLFGEVDRTINKNFKRYSDSDAEEIEAKSDVPAETEGDMGLQDEFNLGDEGAFEAGEEMGPEGFAEPDTSASNGYFFKVVKLDSKGEEICSVCLDWDKTASKLKGTDNENELNRLIYSDGRLYLFFEEGLVIYDDNLTSSEVKLNKALDKKFKEANFYKGKDDAVYASFYDDHYNMVMAEADMYEGKLGKAFAIPNCSFTNNVTPGINKDITYYTNSKIFEYTQGDKESEKLVDFAASNIAVDYLNSYAFVDNENFLALFRNLSDGEYHLGYFTKEDPKNVKPKKTLTMATISATQAVKTAVVDFNKASDEYAIQIVDYFELYANNDYSMYATVIEKLNTDIISGNIPDIILIRNELPINSYISKGLIEDLYPYIEKDPEFDINEFYTHVWDTYSPEGKLYSLTPTFKIQTLAVKKSLLDGRKSWDVNTATDIWKKNKIKYFVNPTNKDNIIETCFTMASSQFVDFSNATCDFDSENFKNMLNFIKMFPDEVDYNSEEMNSFFMDFENIFRSNSVLCDRVQFNEFKDYARILRSEFGEPIECIGFPSADGNGSCFSFDMRFAMSAKSKYKDGCWEFLRYFLTDNYQSQQNSDFKSFPVKKKQLYEMCDKAKEPLFDEFYINGELQRYPLKYYLNGEEFDVEPLSDEEAQDFMAFIDSIQRTDENDTKIMSILKEECKDYFNNTASVNDVAKRIQSRVQIYLYESQ